MKAAETLIVLQARFASRRLPGKALAPLCGRPILARCLDRLLLSGVGHVVLATTTNTEDDALEALACAAGVPVVRGPEHDVLYRFVMAVTQFGARYVIRATADNPAVDIAAPFRTLERLRSTGSDYAVESALPYGTCVEAMTADALIRADAMASSPLDREHVTSLIRRDPRFIALEVPAPFELQRPDVRLSIDSPQDLEFMRRVIGSLDSPRSEAALAAIVAAADALPAALAGVTS